MLKRLVLSFSLLLLSVILLSACTTTDNEGVNEDTIKIYTTLFSLEDFTKRIGGEFVEVINIIPAGVDAHTFEPTVNQMIEIANGDLFIYNSPIFEVYAEAIIDTVEDHGVEVLLASHGIDFYHLDHHDEDHGDDEHFHGDEDPHVWLDPLRGIQLAENIKNKLVTMLPEQENIFQENFDQLKTDLQQLDQEFLTMIDEVTKDTIVVSHAGYSYWEERYGIHQVPISGLSPTNEPSVKQMQKIISFIKNEGIQYLMFEKNIPSNYVETIKDETNTEALWLHNLESLLPEEKNSGADYFQLMKKNIETLRKALQ